MKSSLTKKKKMHNMRIMSCFIWGQNKDHSLGDSTSYTSEKLLQRDGRKASIYVILVKGEYMNQAQVFVKKVSAGHVKVSVGLVTVSAGLGRVSAGLVKVSAGLVKVSTGLVRVSAGHVRVSLGLVKVSTGLVTVSVGLGKVSAGRGKVSARLVRVLLV